MLPFFQERAGPLDGGRNNVGQIHRVLAELHFAPCNARHVQQIVDEPRQMTDLPIDDGAFLQEARIAAERHQLERGEDWRQRVPELVPEHGQELVLGAVRRLGGGAQPVHLVSRSDSSVTSKAMTRIPSTRPCTPRSGAQTTLK